MNPYMMSIPRYLWLGLLAFSVSNVAEARPSNDQRHRSSHYRHDSHRDYRQHYPVGQRYSRLPAGYLALSYGGLNFYYHGGSYYQRHGHDYALIRPPLGLGISILPPAYRTHHHGGHTWYSSMGIFYRWDDWHRQYRVVDTPAVLAAQASSVNAQYAYPRQGQGPEQAARDRYECYLWATQQTGVEPAQVSNADPGNLVDYQRANGACLEARGYSVK